MKRLDPMKDNERLLHLNAWLVPELRATVLAQALPHGVERSVAMSPTPRG